MKIIGKFTLITETKIDGKIVRKSWSKHIPIGEKVDIDEIVGDFPIDRIVYIRFLDVKMIYSKDSSDVDINIAYNKGEYYDYDADTNTDEEK